ncbi:MAG TPA: hypothetical protein VLR93_03630 [Patescibacteria group bacterium]|jgi:hypothetical protein|nr:hypothetical protein [Patescibacteria group bacterium]
MTRPSAARYVLIVILGVVVPLALMPIVAAARTSWGPASPVPVEALAILSAIGGETGIVVLAGLAAFGLVRSVRSWAAAFLVLAVVISHVLGRAFKSAFEISGTSRTTFVVMA